MRFTRKHLPTVAWIVLLLSAAGGQIDAADAKDSQAGNLGCLTILTEPQGVMARIRGSMAFTARTPATICISRAGSYRLELSESGYEDGKLLLEVGDGGFSISGQRLGSLSRSLLFPGWGQFYNSSVAGGSIAAFSTIASAGGIYLAFEEYDEHRDQHEMYAQLGDVAPSRAEEVYFRELARKEAGLANVSRDQLLVNGAILGYQYLSNLVETLLLASAPAIERRDDSTLRFALSRTTMSKALVRSILFPGMGQRYLGNGIRGVLFQIGFLGAALWASERWHDYRKAEFLYELTKDRLSASSSVAEMEEARSEAGKRWDELRGMERARNAAFAAVGSIWFLNIIDIVTTSNRSGGLLRASTFYSGSRPCYGLSFDF